jgi:hypothetical protein
MGRSIAAIAIAISTRFAKNVARNIVAGSAAYSLRLLDDARSLLTRLPGLMPVGLRLVTDQGQTVGVTGAAPALESSCASPRWRHEGKRPVEPRSRAAGIGF